VPRLLNEIYRLQTELTGIGWYDQMILKMMANLLESHHGVELRNKLTFEEFEEIPGRWELIDGELVGK
jgi:hypothetical protein